MSARTSSGSWTGGERSATDIIDLDKFMRGVVRPTRETQPRHHKDNFVVDTGDLELNFKNLATMVGACNASGNPGSPPLSSGSTPITAAECSSTSTLNARRIHNKRFSKDSTLSDGSSYGRRKHRPNRRTVGNDRKSKYGTDRVDDSGVNNSLGAFRAECQKTLLEQQAQIARVTQLCERLTELHPIAAARVLPGPSPPNEIVTTTPFTSTTTSTSQSTKTRDQWRKDKHRSDRCKTYRILLNKLDEMNRLFAMRARTPGGYRRTMSSASSVSVSDKLVSTEPTMYELPPRRSVTRGSRQVTNTCMLDIAPAPQFIPRPNVATSSVVAYESGPDFKGWNPSCKFDLDDPVHLCSQAKLLRAASAETRRARSMEPTFVTNIGRREPRQNSFCGFFRGYWHCIRQYVTNQIFSSDGNGYSTNKC